MIESRTFSVSGQTQNAFKVMHELRLRNLLCDVILSVGGKEFTGHKVVLCGCSPYLCAMFTNGMLESEKAQIEIQGLESWAMGELIEFMYTSVIEINVDNVEGILQGASLLGLHQLRKMCATFLQSQLTASNCLGRNISFLVNTIYQRLLKRNFKNTKYMYIFVSLFKTLCL